MEQSLTVASEWTRPDRIRVVLADGAPVTVSGLALRLDGCVDVSVVGTAGAVEELVAVLGSTQPDVLLLDHDLPGGGSLYVLKQLPSVSGATRTVVVSLSSQCNVLKRIFRAGAAAFLLKRDTLDDLPEVVRRVHTGGTFLSPGVSRDVVNGFLGEQRQPGFISNRQQEILELIACGKTSPEIAALLGIRLRTVHTHRARLMKRLGVHTATALVFRAREEGLV